MIKGTLFKKMLVLNNYFKERNILILVDVRNGVSLKKVENANIDQVGIRLIVDQKAGYLRTVDFYLTSNINAEFIYKEALKLAA